MPAFKAKLEESGRGGHWVTIPDDVVAKLSRRGRTPVRAELNGVDYRGSIVKMGGAFRIGVLKAIKERLGVETGDTLRVKVELDAVPREVEVPPDLAAAIKKAKLNSAWDAMSYSHRRRHADSIADAKTGATRARRIAEILEVLSTKP